MAVLPNADASNRSDVVAQRTETLAAALAQTLARHGVRDELPTLSTAQREAFAAAAMQATRRAMSLRRPLQPDRATTAAPPTGEPR